MGQVDIFEILFDNEYAVYREGDHVRGTVRICTSEDVKYKVIKLELRGVALVHWNPEESDADIDPDDIKGECNKEQYFYKKITLTEKDGNFLDKNPNLAPGEHKFSFECKLPPELPSSFEGKYGQVRYLAKSVIERNWKSNVVTKRAFTVLSGLDLNFIPEAATKIEICKYKQVGGCCTSGSVTIDWSVARSGFVPGEEINIHGAIQNESGEAVTYSRVTLYMIVEYKTKKRKGKECREIESVTKGSTQPDGVTVWHDKLHIPPIPPTGLNRCKLIDVNYELEFKAEIQGLSSPICFIKELYVGTVPISRRDMKSCIAGMYNQPYEQSIDNLDRVPGTSTVSLTQIIAASMMSPDPNPTAPSLSNLDSTEADFARVASDPALDRPPPFSPDHMEHLGSAPEPSAPSSRTLQRPWPETPIADNPSFEASQFGPVSLRDRADDEESIRGELSYAPMYTYYGTLNPTSDKNSEK